MPRDSPLPAQRLVDAPIGGLGPAVPIEDQALVVFPLSEPGYPRMAVGESPQEHTELNLQIRVSEHQGSRRNDEIVMCGSFVMDSASTSESTISDKAT